MGRVIIGVCLIALCLMHCVKSEIEGISLIPIGDRRLKKFCEFARLCRHNGHGVCGENTQGFLRRFLDTCDMLEYNCIHKTDYVKVDRKMCRNRALPDGTFPDSNDSNWGGGD